MTLRDWIHNTNENIRADGLDGFTQSIHELRLGVVRRLLQFQYDPMPIWERDWDVLIVLDACRYDTIVEVEDEFDFLNNRDELTSTASSTTGWVETNFSTDYERELSETAYVTGNPNSIRALPYEFPDHCDCGSGLSPAYDDIYHLGSTSCPTCDTIISGDRRSPFFALEEVWRDNWDNEIGTNPPRPITDAAINIHRTLNPNRLIVHYMQPHYPFITAPELSKGAKILDNDKERIKMTKTVWEYIESGELSEETVREEYTENLRYVLQDVSVLLENIDAETAVITSDHGNAIGEHGVYGHPPNTPIPALVRVPWYTTTAQDERTHESSYDRSNDKQHTATEEVKNRLQDLGYK